MRINFVALSNNTIASHRYHNEIPARELCLLGHDATVTTCPVMDADTYIFSKHFNYADYWSLLGLKKAGKKTAFHCCDDYFRESKVKHEDHYRRMIGEVDIIITPTPQMADIIRRETGRSPVVIPDTYEFPLTEPEFRGLSSPTLRVLWFGHQFNAIPLEEILPLPDFCELKVCSIFPNGLPTFLKDVSYVPWSYPALLDCLKWCDCVIIPLDVTKEYNQTKSANRLIESVRRGKFVIASPIPAYTEFDDTMFIGDIHEGLQYLYLQDETKLPEPDDIEILIKKCQAKIEEKYAPALIGKKWEEVLCG